MDGIAMADAKIIKVGFYRNEEQVEITCAKIPQITGTEDFYNEDGEYRVDSTGTFAVRRDCGCQYRIVTLAILQ